MDNDFKNLHIKLMDDQDYYTSLVESILSCVKMSLKESTIHSNDLKINPILSEKLRDTVGAVNVSSIMVQNPVKDSLKKYKTALVIYKSTYDADTNKVNKEVLVELAVPLMKLSDIVSIVITLMQVTSTDYLIYCGFNEDEPRPMKLEEVKSIYKDLLDFEKNKVQSSL